MKKISEKTVKEIANLLGTTYENVKENLNKLDDSVKETLVSDYEKSDSDEAKKRILSDYISYKSIKFNAFIDKLSEKLKGIYSSEELTVIFASEMDLLCDLFKNDKYDIIETNLVALKSSYKNNKGATLNSAPAKVILEAIVKKII